MSTCLVTGGSLNDLAPIAVLLMNVKATQSWVDHVVVYHDGIPEKQQQLMQRILPVEFIRYRFPGNRKKFNEIVRYVYTEMVFCKYECLKLLDQFDYVVWSDYDVIFQHDVRELIDFQEDTSGWKSLLARPEHGCSRFSSQIRGKDKSDLYRICPSDYLNVCTGLIVLSKSFLNDYVRLYNECISYTERFGEYLVLPEQAIFDMVLYQNHIEPEAIDWCYATRPTGTSADKTAPILHAISQPKFWNGLHNDTWQENYAKWRKMGGGIMETSESILVA